MWRLFLGYLVLGLLMVRKHLISYYLLCWIVRRHVRRIFDIFMNRLIKLHMGNLNGLKKNIIRTILIFLPIVVIYEQKVLHPLIIY